MEDSPWPLERSVTAQRLGIAFNDYIELFGPAFDDNSSNQYPCSCLPCPDDQPLWWLILRWLKMMLLKVARSYNAKPLVLVIAPLLVGLTVGYILGRREESIVSRKRNIHLRCSSATRWIKIQEWLSLWGWRALAVFSEPIKESLVDDKEGSVAGNMKIQATRHNLSSSTIVAPLSDIVPEEREDRVRENLNSDEGMQYESGVDPSQVPRHVAVIMDGNRRYGTAKYGSVSKGHWDGSSKLVEFAKWCIAEKISVLTVYAFSTENWTRDPAEVAALMAIFAKYSDELRVEALKRNIRIHVLSTDSMRVSLMFRSFLCK